MLKNKKIIDIFLFFWIFYLLILPSICFHMQFFFNIKCFNFFYSNVIYEIIYNNNYQIIFFTVIIIIISYSENFIEEIKYFCKKIGQNICFIIFKIIICVIRIEFFERYARERPEKIRYSFTKIPKDLFLICILYPIFEEFFFRRLLFQKIKGSLAIEDALHQKKYLNIFSIFLISIFSSLVFAICHMKSMDSRYLDFFYFKFLGLQLCLLNEITGTITVGIISHSIYNATVIFLEILHGNIEFI